MSNRKLIDVYHERSKFRKRLRDVGISIGKLPPGPLNAITDVAGVKVGHKTLIDGTGKRKPGTGPIRTGVTTILPSPNIFEEKLIGGGFILNGAGEMSGMIQLNEWGLLETPIALTNTMSVGAVSDGIAEWMTSKFSDLQKGKQVIIPVVGECDDSFLNDSAGLHVRKKHVIEALDSMKDGEVQEGAVGAGTGMICCDLKSGIGTSSRIMRIDSRDFILGCMVLSNFGEIEDLRVDGVPVGIRLEEELLGFSKRRENYGSIIVVLATDLPVSSVQIQRICKRASLGIGRVGSYAAHGSGEIIIGFSTANTIKPKKNQAFYHAELLHDSAINIAYQAAVEVTEEAILNSLTAAVEMEGIEGNRAPALPLERLQELYANARD